MIDQHTREQVRQLLSQGTTQREVARLTGVSRRTVVRIARELSGGLPGRVGRPSKTRPYTEMIREALIADPEIRSCVLLVQAREDGFNGSRAALYKLVQLLRGEVEPRSQPRGESRPASEERLGSSMSGGR